MTIKLTSAALGEIAHTAAVPAYDPIMLSPSMLHFGVGNFHRAHQANMNQDCCTDI